MEVQLECGCGEEVSGFARDGQVSSHVRCAECRRMYAVTVTPINEQN